MYGLLPGLFDILCYKKIRGKIFTLEGPILSYIEITVSIFFKGNIQKNLDCNPFIAGRFLLIFSNKVLFYRREVSFSTVIE